MNFGKRLSRSALVLILCASMAAAQATPSAGPTNDLEERFRKADLDGDGKLSEAEARRASWFVDEVDEFQRIDKDHSGTVTLAEIVGAIAGEVSSWFGADTNKDGRVSEAEAKAQRGLGDRFSVADANHDGMVTREEVENMSRRSYYRDAELPAVAPNIIEKRF